MQVNEHGAFQSGKFFAGHDVQGLHAHYFYAVFGEFGEAVADAAHRAALSGDFFADDLRGIGPDHRLAGEGLFKLLVHGLHGGQGFGHAGAEGHQQNALLGRVGGVGRGGRGQGRKEQEQKQEQTGARKGRKTRHGNLLNGALTG